MLLSQDVCTRALEARDARFDGVFFVGIRSTGIYCRPICPARATLRRNRRFFANAGAAERAGFRPCLRCRPELAPGVARIDAVPRIAHAAARQIAAGALNGSSVDILAGTLGVSGRQLRRAMQEEVGVSPIELAQTHRLLLAKQLLTETHLPVSQVAHASGFQSLRRFNALFLERYRLAPQQLRRAAGVKAPPRDAPVTLSLAYRPPLVWDALLTFLARRAAPSVELVEHGVYMRTLRVGSCTGTIRVQQKPRSASALTMEVSASLLPELLRVSAIVRRLFDLDADPDAIESHLLGSDFPAIPEEDRGLRVPGAADSFELLVRAILGQQISVKGASTLMTRLTERFAERIETPYAALTHLPVEAEKFARASVKQISAIGIPAARANTILAAARAVADGSLRLDADADVPALTRQLQSIPGIGPWTAEYVLMRAVHWPDAFPASDLVLRRAAGNLSPGQLVRMAERWRPWRAYAAMHLWRRA